jgi:hypothetical protein
MALQFPNKADPNQSENPLVNIHSEDNGITYYWDPASNSWILVTAQTVNKDYVDGRDELRYRRDGSDFIYGNVVIRRESDFAADPTVVITTEGTLMLSSDNKILFSSISDNLPSLVYGTPGNESVALSFDSSFLLPQKPFRYNCEAGPRVFLIENDGVGEVKLFDIQTGPGVSYTKNIIKIPNDKNSSFIVCGDDSYTKGLFVKGNNDVEVSANSTTAFVVRNLGTTSKDVTPFTVETTSHKLFASKEYNDGLKNGSGQVTIENGKTFQNFNEQNLLATKGYVDAQNKEEPGYNICADRESDAKSGGFWRNGSTLYWKL